MSWEALTAVAAVANTTIVLVAAVAAVLQIRHLRLGNQLQSYLHIMKEAQSPELIEGRRYLRSADFTDPETLDAATTPQVDQRITAVGIHFQSVARLLNRGVLDEELFAAYFDMTPTVWKTLQPVAAVLRERSGVPMWIDIEYLAYRVKKENLLYRYLSRFPDDFVEQARIGEYIAAADHSGDSG